MMLNRKKTLRKLNFTLIELMMAMAIFSLLSLAMMRFFSSAQTIWSKSSQRGELHSDARVALDLMARDLQCVMYSNENTSQSFCPFWFQKIRDISDPNPGELEENICYPKLNGSNIELTQLNFIAVTDIKPRGAVSNVCEVRYTFVPAGMYLEPDTGDLKITPTLPSANGVAIEDDALMAKNDSDRVLAGKPKVIREGCLVRSCTPDRKPDNSVNPKWNFKSFPRRTATGGIGSLNRVNDIWSNASSDVYEKIIPGVYSLKFTCYYIDSNGWQDYKPMRYLGPNSCSFISLGGTIETGDLMNGTPLPMAVKIDLAMMSPTDWREWKAAISRDNIPDAEKIKQQRMRTFSKTVFINSKFSE